MVWGPSYVQGSGFRRLGFQGDTGLQAFEAFKRPLRAREAWRPEMKLMTYNCQF